MSRNGTRRRQIGQRYRGPSSEAGARTAARTRRASCRTSAIDRRAPAGATLAIGDGANDLPMIREAGLGVAFRAHPTVADAA